MSALSSIASQAFFQPSGSSSSCSSTDSRFAVLQKTIADAVKKGEISQDKADTLSQALQLVQDSLDQAAQTDGVSPYSPQDIAKMFASLKLDFAAAKQPAPTTPSASGGLDITV